MDKLCVSSPVREGKVRVSDPVDGRTQSGTEVHARGVDEEKMLMGEVRLVGERSFNAHLMDCGGAPAD